MKPNTLNMIEVGICTSNISNALHIFRMQLANHSEL